MFFSGRCLRGNILFKVLNMVNNSFVGTQSYEAQAQLLKVLTHPARLAILNMLRDGEHCVCHMEAHLGYRQAYISQQLSVLREAGIIQDRRDGWNIFYRVIRPEIYQVVDMVAGMSGETAGASEESPRKIDCPCPKCSSEKKST